MSQYQIRLSLIAELQLQTILDYLELEWSEKVKSDFLTTFTDLTYQISKFPKSCPAIHEKPWLIKALVNKHVSFIYQIQK